MVLSNFNLHFDAITASTISSRAFLESIQDAFNAYLKYKEKKIFDKKALKTDNC